MTIYDVAPASDGRGGPHPLAGVPQAALDAAVKALAEAENFDRRGDVLIAEGDVEPVAHAILAAALASAPWQDHAGTTVTDWGVRTHTTYGAPYDQKEPSEAVAQGTAEQRTSHLTSAPGGTFNGRPFDRCEVVSRQRTSYPDVVTPWLPVQQDGASDD